MKRFHFSQFADVRSLVALKLSNTISVCIPTLNEAATIGTIISQIRAELIEAHPLVDEILVIDSGSDDGTREIAQAAGATVFLSSDIAPAQGAYQGKGENLWKSLYVATGDIICYIDGDISNIHAGFVTGLVGPILSNSGIDYVKGYYERPLDRGKSTLASGGGRVSEILIRPILSLFYPELTHVLQPLSGEYAARRAVFESLAFPVGYGVEIAHLIDLSNAGLLPRMAQTDLVRRVHRNRDDDELGCMAFAILHVIFRRLQRDGKLQLTIPLPSLYQSYTASGNHIEMLSKSIPEPERPPTGKTSPPAASEHLLSP